VARCHKIESAPKTFEWMNEHQQNGENSAANWQEGLEAEISKLLAGGSHVISDEIHDKVDQVLLQPVLESTGGNIGEASARLGISRPTLRNRMRQLHLIAK